jgi:hypothetical protein
VRSLALLCLTACGRLSFDASATTDGATGDGTRSMGVVGPRWITRFGEVAGLIPIAGADGRISVAQSFSGTLTGDGFSVQGLGFTSTAVVRYDADGTIRDSRVFDATGFCDLRTAVADGTSVVFAGFTQGSLDTSRGICSIAASRQDPLALRIADDGTESIVAHWVASVANAQTWGMTRYDSGQLALAGVYSGQVTMDAALPMAQADPNVFVARYAETNPASASWSYALLSTGAVHSGPAATVASRGYFMGGFQGNPMLLGTSLSSTGGFDAYLARIDEDGSPIFVKGFGSTMDEASYGNRMSIATQIDGGVVVSLESLGDVTYDGQPFLAANGAGLVLYIDGSGALVGGRRFPSMVRVARVGSTIYAAAAVTAPTDLLGVTYTPEGRDALIVELDASLVPVRIVGAVSGAGSQDVDQLVAIEPGALALSGTTTGATTFGTTTFDTGNASTRYVAVVGL